MKITDASHERVFTTTGPVEAAQTYTYDALYRLIDATGREHTALTDTPFFNDPNQFKQSRHTLLNDMTQLANYTRQYAYDDAGNLTTIQHVGTNPFTRNIDIDTGTNRALLRPEVGTPDFANSFDNNGNQIKIDHLAGIEWNYRDNIAKAVVIDRSASSGTDDAEYYVYDASGQRVRKVTERVNSGIVEIEEKIYLGTVEIKRFYQLDGSLTKRLDRSDLHVMDDKSRIAIVNHWTQDDLLREIEDTSWLNTNRQRYQYSNHLSSSSLELNATAAIISYEEYYPYGGTSFIAGNNQKEVNLKEYRFSAKERDDFTGFYYHGARYFAPWIGRWMSADPAGPVDGVNLYVYSRGNPLRLSDPSGTQSDDEVNQTVEQPTGYREWNDPGTGRNMEFWFEDSPAEPSRAAEGDSSTSGEVTSRDIEAPSGADIVHSQAAELETIISRSIDEGDYGAAAAGGALWLLNATVVAAPLYAWDLTIGYAWNAGVKAGGGFKEGDYDRALQGSTELLTLGAAGKLDQMLRAIPEVPGGFRAPSPKGASESAVVETTGEGAQAIPRSGPITRSVGAMSRAEELARKLHMNVNSPTTRQVLNSLDDTVEKFVGEFRKGSIWRELPREVKDMRLEDALKFSTKVRKLLTDGRFVK